MESDSTADWVVAVLALTALGVSADEALGALRALSKCALADEAVSCRFCTVSSHDVRRVSARPGALVLAGIASADTVSAGTASADTASAGTTCADTTRPLFTGQVFATRTRRTREGDEACFGAAER